MSYRVDLDPQTDRELSAILALESSPLTKSELTAVLVRASLDQHPRIGMVRAALATPVQPATVENVHF